MIKQLTLAPLLLLLALSTPAHAQNCTPEQAEAMSDELMEEASVTVHNYLVNNRQIKLQKDKIGYVLVARAQELPEQLKPLVADVNRVADLVKQKSLTACDESERVRRKYRL